MVARRVALGQTSKGGCTRFADHHKGISAGRAIFITVQGLANGVFQGRRAGSYDRQLQVGRELDCGVGQGQRACGCVVSHFGDFVFGVVLGTKFLVFTGRHQGIRRQILDGIWIKAG